MRYCISFGSPKTSTAGEAGGHLGDGVKYLLAVPQSPFQEEGCDVPELPAATHCHHCSAEVF